MVALIITFPQLVTGGVEKAQAVDINAVEIVLPETGYDDEPTPPTSESEPTPGAAPSSQ